MPVQSTPPRIPIPIDKVDGRGTCPDEARGKNMAGSQPLHHSLNQASLMNLKVPGSSDRKNHKLSVNRNVSFLLPLPSSSRRPPRAIRSQLRTPAPFRPEAVTSSSATIVVSAVLANASVGECSTVDIASRHLARDPSLRLLARTQAPLLSCPSDESPPSPKRTACKPFRNLPLPPQAETSGYLCTAASRPTSRDFRGVG